MRILIVDDEAVVRTYLARRLTREGYEVVTASSGRETLYALETSRFDATLIDVNLAGEDGISLAKRVRESNPQIKVIVMSGDETNRDRVEKENLGPLLLKPIDFDILHARLNP